MPSIADNLTAVHAEIATACARAGRDPREVRLIAVTKEQMPEVLPALAAAGCVDLGENRVEHLRLMRAAAGDGARFHAIGRVQSRQLGEIAELADCLHSLHDPDHVAKLARACAARGRRLPVFIQANVADDAAKAGADPAALPAFIDRVRAHGELELVGLMTMAPLVAGPAASDAARPVFAALRELARRHGLSRLSMGMSEDFVVAVEEGATDVRVGRRLFR
ncbi:MAG: YggS family pyridoxal phosphate-dependent enzyme [Planctomycetes bacterium]|nr:YggS family pyridoxal phosphate-dependent enzyme [Planctomycetota bacterium]